jgi:tetratricopeptide (TPR) repeat protein
LCAEIESLKDLLRDSPALTFDLAKCAEMEADQQAATDFLERYVSLAPGALDRKDVRVKLDFLSTLDEMKSTTGDLIRKHYANAARALEVQRLDIALDEYLAADKLAPGSPETQWRLGQLYESCGNTRRTKEILGDLYSNPAASAEQRQEAQAILDSVDSLRARYDRTIAEARASASDLKAQADHLSLPLRADRLATVAELLAPAVEVFRNAWEVNELLAYVHEHSGNQRLLFRSLDVMWANGRPVSFDANVRAGSGKGKQAAAKQPPVPSRIDVMPDSFEVRALGYGPINRESVKRIETTRAGVIRVELSDARVILMTIDNMSMLTVGSPSTGYWGDLLGVGQMGQIPGISSQGKIMPLPFRRALANRGTRIFQRYLGFEEAKFGSERFTLKEKAAVTGWLALNVFTIVSAFNGSTNLFTSIDNIYEYTGGFSNSIASAISFVRLVHYQQPITASSQFRAIPIGSEPDSLRTSWK